MAPAALGFTRPRRVAEVCQLLREHGEDAKVIGGGTALVLMMSKGFIDPELLVSLRDVEGLHGIEVRDGDLRIGASETLAAVARSPEVARLFPSLRIATRSVANARIRNMATLGGNLAEADYASDPPATLASLDARCVIQGPDGSRTVPVATFVTDFYTPDLATDEVVTEILVPLPAPGTKTTYLKYKTRAEADRPAVGVAARVVLDDGAVRDLDVVIGAVASTPQRFPAVTGQAAGRPLDETLARQIADGYAEAISPIDDSRGSAWYRRRMIAVLVRRALRELAGAH